MPFGPLFPYTIRFDFVLCTAPWHQYSFDDNQSSETLSLSTTLLCRDGITISPFYFPEPIIHQGGQRARARGRGNGQDIRRSSTNRHQRGEGSFALISIRRCLLLLGKPLHRQLGLNRSRQVLCVPTSTGATEQTNIIWVSRLRKTEASDKG